MNIERWLPIPDEDGYEVSDQGRVRSLDRVAVMRNGVKRTFPGTELKPVDGRPYLQVGLRGKTRRVHNLVARAFIGPRPPGLDVRHLNGDHKDNRLENLKYGTKAQNGADTVAHGRHHLAGRPGCGRGHLFEGENLGVGSRGSRMCIACHRGHAAVSSARKEGIKMDIDLACEYQYELIMWS